MNEHRDLEGLSALVTGATSGIGRAAAEHLAGNGAELIVHGRDAARGSTVVDTITADGGKARFVAADLSDPSQLDDLAQQGGPVDVLVDLTDVCRALTDPEVVSRLHMAGAAEPG